MPDKAELLAEAARLHTERKAARQRALEAVVRANQAGCSLREIGDALKLSHTAVRKMIDAATHLPAK